MSDPELVASVQRDEGYRAHPYRDTRGVWTIAWGHNLEAHATSAEIAELHRTGCTIEQGLAWLHGDLEDAIDACAHFTYWAHISHAAQRVVAEMCFQLGMGGLAGFRELHAALQEGEYADAAWQILEGATPTTLSALAQECPERAMRYALRLRAA